MKKKNLSRVDVINIDNISEEDEMNDDDFLAFLFTLKTDIDAKDLVF